MTKHDKKGAFYEHGARLAKETLDKWVSLLDMFIHYDLENNNNRQGEWLEDIKDNDEPLCELTCQRCPLGEPILDSAVNIKCCKEWWSIEDTFASYTITEDLINDYINCIKKAVTYFTAKGKCQLKFDFMENTK